MEFYQRIATAYDDIFPLNKAQVNFIENSYPLISGKHVLDAGCGTGSLAIALGRRGARVKAFDLDGAMIIRAKEKCPQALNVLFEEGDLLSMEDKYKEQSFDLIYCFGNTLAHLDSIKEIEQFIKSAKYLLKPTGVLMFQVVNYDRVIKDNIESLPTISTDNYTFERNYKMTLNGKIAFSTQLNNLRTKETNNQTVELLPILKGQIDEALKPDFSEIEFYGSFNFEKWTEGSFHTIVKATV